MEELRLKSDLREISIGAVGIVVMFGCCGDDVDLSRRVLRASRRQIVEKRRRR